MKSLALKALLFLTALLCLSCGKKEGGAGAPTQEKSQKTDAVAAEAISQAEARIWEAVRNNDTVTLRRVIFDHSFVKLNSLVCDGDTLLSFAIKKRFPLIVSILLEKGAHPDLISSTEDFPGQTPLMLAAHIGDIRIINSLLDARASINLQDRQGDTALHKAIKNAYDGAVRVLVAAGADLQLKNERQETPLDTARRLNRREAIDLLSGLMSMELGTPSKEVFRRIVKDADILNFRKMLTLYPELIKDYEEINPLAIAVDSANDMGGFAIAQTLLVRSFSPDGPEKSLTTPLIRSVVLRKTEFTELFLKFGADPQKTDQEGRLPLEYAIENNDEKMVDLLVNSGAEEKVDVIRRGRRYTFKACKLADAVQKKLRTAEELSDNHLIQLRLGCSWPY